MNSFAEVRDRIEELAPTTDFAQIEEEVIDPCDLSDDEKAALWLLAWTYVPKAQQRALAMTTAQALAERNGSWAFTRR